MLSHLKLHFNTSQRNDEAVLGAYPSTIRRRVLRYLYLDVLKASLHGSGSAAACRVNAAHLRAGLQQRLHFVARRAAMPPLLTEC